MKQLVCEMCGSADMLKQDGAFVCQSCGTKYSVEEAKKMMIEGIVDVQGTVKVDESDKLDKLYRAARNAREASDSETALKHYETISANDPDSWEALFFSVILKTESITNGEISSAAISVKNCLPKVFELLSESDLEYADKLSAVLEICEECKNTAVWLTSASYNYYKTATKGNGMMALTGVGGAISSVSSTSKALEEDKTRRVNIANIIFICGNCVEKYFDMNDEICRELVVALWEAGLELDSTYKNDHGSYMLSDESKETFVKKIGKYNPEKQQEIQTKTQSSGGCYVATAVYGSYDCPEVWTLRRYRDYTLAETWYGRMFIKTYYAVSPILVKWFGHTEWFKKMWQGKLDRMVAELQEKGIESTPYEDRCW